MDVLICLHPYREYWVAVFVSCMEVWMAGVVKGIGVVK